MNHSNDSPTQLDHAQYDRQTGTYRLPSGSGTERLSTTIVLALAELTETDPLKMEPLYDTIDPDVLDEFVEHTPGSNGGELSFVARECRVTVHADGHVVINPR